MRHLTALTILLTLGMASSAFADGFTQVVGPTTNATRTRTVFNDSGSSIVSGEIVVWQNDGAGFEFDRSGFPYVETTTSTDSPWIAGIVAVSQNCPDQQMCEIVVEGPAIAKIAHETDAITEDNLVSTSSVDGQVGDWGNGDDTCFVGMAMELRDVDSGTIYTHDGLRMWINVKVGCN